jgi:hypothetical protein
MSDKMKRIKPTSLREFLSGERIINADGAKILEITSNYDVEILLPMDVMIEGLRMELNVLAEQKDYQELRRAFFQGMRLYSNALMENQQPAMCAFLADYLEQHMNIRAFLASEESRTEDVVLALLNLTTQSIRQIESTPGIHQLAKTLKKGVTRETSQSIYLEMARYMSERYDLIVDLGICTLLQTQIINALSGLHEVKGFLPWLDDVLATYSNEQVLELIIEQVIVQIDKQSRKQSELKTFFTLDIEGQKDLVRMLLQMQAARTVDDLETLNEQIIKLESLGADSLAVLEMFRTNKWNAERSNISTTVVLAVLIIGLTIATATNSSLQNLAERTKILLHVIAAIAIFSTLSLGSTVYLKWLYARNKEKQNILDEYKNHWGYGEDMDYVDDEIVFQNYLHEFVETLVEYHRTRTILLLSTFGLYASSHDDIAQKTAIKRIGDIIKPTKGQQNGGGGVVGKKSKES